MIRTKHFIKKQQLKLIKNSLICLVGQLCDPDLDEQIVEDKNGTIPDPCSDAIDLWITEDDLIIKNVKD